MFKFWKFTKYEADSDDVEWNLKFYWEFIPNTLDNYAGQLRWTTTQANFHTFIPTSTWNSIALVGMQIFDISSKIAKVIKISDIQMIESP